MEENNYQRIAKAIEYIRENFRDQPSLEEIAEKIHLSPSHFQRIFTEWAGTSPKKFLQYISIQHAKKVLIENTATLFDATIETGLSSTSRLHDMFIKIEGMTPADYKNGGKNLQINYCFAECCFGEIIISSTDKGLCYLAFHNDAGRAFDDLVKHFPYSTFVEKIEESHKIVLQIFNKDWSTLPQIKLHLKGTEFQLKVWESLLKIPMGSLSTYGSIAHNIGNPNASRAVGTAIGSNPVAFLIPCHRVIQQSGNIGGYMWGPTRKSAIIGWEGAAVYG